MKLRLLIATQTVDREDPILGFFHEWLVALSPKFESIEVICLREGTHALPANIRVHSLGKEKGGGKLAYAFRFLSLIRSLKGSYDAVLVHMNPEYVMLGGLFWKQSGKKVCLWYNHPKGGFRLSAAMAFSDKIFHTSPYAASARTKKSVRMPAGIDTELFKPQEGERKRFGIYLQGRIAPSKRVNAACEALELVRSEGIEATLTVVGPEDDAYVRELRKRYASLVENRAVAFLGPKPNRETPSLYASHAVSLNLAASGHYDKTVLESMASGTPVIVAGRAFEGLVPEEWAGADTPEKVAGALMRFFALPEAEREDLGRRGREKVVRQESLPALIEAFAREIR